LRSYLHVGGRGLNRQHETGRQKEFDKIPKKNLHLNNKRKEKQEGVISHLTAREEKTKKKSKRWMRPHEPHEIQWKGTQ